jgi:hypothetical protein
MGCEREDRRIGRSYEKEEEFHSQLIFICMRLALKQDSVAV